MLREESVCGSKKTYDKCEHKKGNKTAIIITARKLASTIFAMLKSREEYKENIKA